MRPSHTARALSWQSLLALLGLAVLTGCFGCFVPRIHGLSQLGDYYGSRVLLCAAILLVTGVVGLACTAQGHPLRKWTVAAWVVLLMSVVMNLVLGQDPLAAWLNVRAPHLNYDRALDRLVMVDNHEWITLDHDLGVYYVGGPGVQVPELPD